MKRSALALLALLVLFSPQPAHAYTNTTATPIQIATDQQLYYGVAQASVILTLTNPGGTARTIDLTTFHTNLANVDAREAYLQETVNVTVADHQLVKKQGVYENGTAYNYTAYDVVGFHQEQRQVWTDLTGETNFINAYKEATQPSLLAVYSSYDSLHKSLVPGVDSAGLPVAKKGRLYGLTLAPGESKTFRLLITFPIGSTGEFYIETYDQATGTNLGLLDPWWNSSWNYSRIISVTNNAAATLQAGYTVNVTFDHASNVSAGKSNANGTDVRVVYNDTTELDRVNLTAWNTASTTIAFRLQANISASSTDSTNYKLYYGNPSAGAPPAEKNSVFQYATPLANAKGLWFAEKPANASIMEDTSGNGNNGTLLNGTAWADGKFGGGLRFYGNGSSVRVWASDSLNVTNITIAFWARGWFSGDSYLIDKQLNINPFAGYIARIRDLGTGSIWVRWQTGGSGQCDAGSGTIANGTWFFAAYTHNGTHGKCYINGALEGTETTPGLTGNFSNTNNLYLGVQYRENTGEIYDYLFNGTIDSVAIYNRALSDAEIAAMYIATDPTTALQGEQSQTNWNASANITLSSPSFTPVDGSPNTVFTFSVALNNPEQDNVNLSLFINNGIVNSSTFAWNASASLKWTASSAGSYTYHWEATNLGGNKTGRYPTTGEATGPEVGIFYTKNFTVPSGATELVAGSYWYGLYNGSGNITVTLAQPNGSILSEFGVPTVVDNLDTVTIALPAIDYNLTSYSGYRELTVSSPAIGSWQLKVRHSNVTKVETRVRWS